MRWFRSERPPSYWDVFGRHFPLALVTGLVLIVSTFIPLERLPLIPCTFLRWTGYPCPFCGMTRAFVAMGHGHVQAAFIESPLAVLLYAGAWVVFLWNAVGLASGRRLYLTRVVDNGSGEEARPAVAPYLKDQDYQETLSKVGRGCQTRRSLLTTSPGQTGPITARHWIITGALLLVLNWIYRLAMGLR